MIWPARAAAPSAFMPEPAADREEMLAAAIAAPSACDSRNWHLICLCTRESIQGLAGAVAAGVERAVRGLVGDGAYAAACVRRNSFSQGAPMAAAAYMEPMQYAGARLTAALRARGVDYDGQMRMQPDRLLRGRGNGEPAAVRPGPGLRRLLEERPGGLRRGRAAQIWDKSRRAARSAPRPQGRPAKATGEKRFDRGAVETR